MRGIIFLLGIFYFASVSCDKLVSGNTNSDFQEYLKAIPTINSPLTMSCDSNLTPINTAIPDSLVKKFGINSAQVYGKFKTSGSFTLVMYLVAASADVPVIKTTDNAGRPIDTLCLLGNCGANEDCYYANSFAKISSDFSITINDTIKTCERDTLDRPMPGSEKIEIKKRIFVINDFGKIVELK